MKQQLERSEDVQTRKLTQPERADLYERQVKRLTGLTLKGPLEPSDALVDVFCGIYDANRLRFIPWEKYTSKEAEIDRENRAEHLFAIDSNGKLKVENKPAEATADTSTEIMLQYALQRRGLSMDQANLLEYTKHQAWIDKLIRTRLQLPPPGYNKPTFRQLLEADKKLFEVLADCTRSGVQATATGRPLDAQFEKATNAPEVLHLLQPLMSKSVDKNEDKANAPASSVRVSPYPATAPSRASKGKGKGKNKTAFARMPTVLVEGGFDVLPIDFHGNKHRPHVHVVELDLRKDSTWGFLKFLVRSRRPFHFHAAPPCGTSSRARDRPLGPEEHGPPKLRSEEFPLGFPWLTGYWKDKVDSANNIYLKLIAFCLWLNALGIFWSIENPGNSYMWNIDEFDMLKAVSHFVLFHSCLYGSRRKKLTAFLTNLVDLTILHGFCQDDHEHLPWGQTYENGKLEFDTSKEAAYPRDLCERIANILADAAKRCQVYLVPASVHDVDPRVAVGKQPRGRKLPAVVAEFLIVKTIRVQQSDLPVLDSKQCLVHAYHGIPVGSKQLRVAKAKRGNSEDSTMLQLRVFGIYRSMLQFYNDAKQVLHPFDTFRGLPDSMLRVICATLHRSPLETMRFRLHKLKQWRQLADMLQADNAEIFKGMDSGCSAVLKGKRLALLERLANDIDWPDRSLHEEIRNGFKLVGMQQPTGVFAADVKPRTLSADELENQLEFIKPALWNKMQSEQQADYAHELWEATMEEVTDKKWLEGPYDFDELEVMFNHHWLPVRRFAVWQRSKWRAIDDFSECGVNSSFAYFERVDLKALDETLWIACCFTKFCLHEDRYDFTLSSGERLAGNVSEAWRQLPEDQVQVVSKTVDLKSAYKQFAILPDNRKLSVLSLKRPSDGKVHGFVSRTLPFGSVASVLHFNRVARLLHQLGLELGIVWANYYDDYPVVDFKALSKQTDAAVRALTSMLGFKCAVDKELPFAQRSELLGVVLDSSDSTKGVVRVSNKEDRLDELSTTVQSILDEGRVIPRDLPSLFGRALFVESQLLGRAGRLALSELRALEKQNAASVKLTDIQMQAFAVLLDRYKHNIPRTIKNLRTELPVVVFTDGACEQVDGDLHFALLVACFGILVQLANRWPSVQRSLQQLFVNGKPVELWRTSAWLPNKSLELRTLKLENNIR
eukprot:Skav231273  [mRNA]  locus=scaffold2436:470175:474164:- [translate_table: standard]